MRCGSGVGVAGVGHGCNEVVVNAIFVLVDLVVVIVRVRFAPTVWM